MMSRRFIFLFPAAALAVLPATAEPSRTQRLASEAAHEQPMSISSTIESELWNPPFKDGTFWPAARKTADAQYELIERLAKENRLKRLVSVCDEFVNEWHNDPRAPKVQILLADACAERGRRVRAIREYQYALRYFSNESALGAAELAEKQMRLARELEGELHSGFLGMGAETGSKTLVSIYLLIAKNAPTEAFAPECYYRAGLLWETDIDKPDEAIGPYEQVFVNYPGSEFAPLAACRAARCRVTLSDRYPSDARRTASALVFVDAVLKAYEPLLSEENPERVRELRKWHDHLFARISHARFEEAAFYDRIRHNPSAAVAAYTRFLEQFPDAPDSGTARARMKALSEKLPSPSAD